MKKLTSIMLLSVLISMSAEATAGSDRLSNDFTFLKMLNGVPVYAGTIVATTVKDNSNTGTPFTLVAGSLLLIQCDAAAYVGHQAAAAAAGTTTSNGLRVEAYEKYYLLLLNAEAYVEALAVSGTANCKVWRMR